ncbi:hypothetical protein [Nocardioides donggukensis]|uniref:Uncharacterized protein n=1 Tax=Nocardioides donggukensis TaxID=2774019 RepID=A0A927K8J1_9ACTN|nr:hypothetical protein [Nocardioides donggukensis]MBD8871160.1 hypothetical protein [Nocardioides donggukensis]
MALDRTSGFDMLVQISEQEINSQLAAAFLSGTVFPPSLSLPVTMGGATGTADINFQTPTLDLDRPRPQVGLTLPFAGSQLALTAPVPLTVAPLGGTIVIVDAVQIVSEAGGQAAVIDFTSGAPTVTVDFDAASETRLAPLLAAVGMSIAQAENTVAGLVLAQLQSTVQRVLLTPFIPVVDDTSPTTIFDLAVTTVNDLSAADRDCLAFGVRMSSDAGGNINNVTTNMIPAGSPSLVMMSNTWLLAKVMRPQVATSLGRPLTDFDTPLRLNRSIPAPGGTGTLTSLVAFIEGNRIRVDGRATASGTGWSAVSTFTFFVSLSIDATGSIAITTTTPTVATDVDLEWWVWLAGLALGGLFGGIVGAIVAAVVLAITESVVEGVANSLISSGISGSIGTFASIPLGPIGSRLAMTSLVLDDLELRGTISRAPAVPVRNSGSRTPVAGISFDLDAGSTSATPQPGTDLVWDPASGLTTRGAARLSVTGRTYGALDPLAISALPLTSTSIPLSMIPSFADLGPFTVGSRVVFGMRTGDGRLVRCRAWRNTFDQRLTLEWVTYDNPVAQLDLTQRWCVAERGPVEEYISADCSRCTTSEVAWRGVIEAWPRLAPFPIDYQWCVCGQVLEEDSGEVQGPDGPISYKLVDRKLCLRGQLGQTIDCEVCVSAIDARGHELYTCLTVLQPGEQTTCRPCVPRHTFELEFAEIATELQGYRPVFTPTGKDPAPIG